MIPSKAEMAVCRAFFGDAPRSLAPLPATGPMQTSGLSGSRIMLVEPLATPCGMHADRWVVKQFGPGTSLHHARWVHGLMGHLRLEGISAVPMVRSVPGVSVSAPPLDASSSDARAIATTIIEDAAGGLWEAVQFLPGRPIAVPDAAVREEAMKTLAEIHRAAARLPGTAPRRMQSRGLTERIDRAALLRRRPWRERWGGDVGREARSRCGEPFTRLFEQAIDSFSVDGDAALDRIARHATPEVSCQAVLRDIWSDHVLFEGGRVCGVIDYHAAGIDTAATDLARLVGSWMLAAGTPAALTWEECLTAYESIRPLQDDERRLVGFLHHAGVIIAIDNWFRWLVEERRAFPDAVAGRLGQLVAALPEAVAATRQSSSLMASIAFRG